ncbi:class I SAM-dependent methyltransferase [Actinotalea solisilvae]|uniref:class I SAM-dependent methyltransferase n=1 Tax=Actinotalea solisilvae TaxID=2072922 RepID=UPI0027DCCE19|nr:class I SAM-dependent methyltransferase [Actinotalea solisilvae]
MDAPEDDGWSALAPGWAAAWGSFADPVRRVLLDATRTGPGTRLLDVGCGSGELLALAAERGADARGADAAPGMVALAAARAPAADVRVADAAHLPWPDASVDVVTAVATLHLVEDLDAALAEAVRVLVPGGLLAVAGWAEAALNDLDVVGAAVALADDDEPPPDGPLAREGGLEAVLTAAGLAVEASGVVGVPWSAADDAALVRGALLGEDPGTLARTGPVVVAAAVRFRTPDGGYLLRNAFRWAVARRP